MAKQYDSSSAPNETPDPLKANQYGRAKTHQDGSEPKPGTIRKGNADSPYLRSTKSKKKADTRLGVLGGKHDTDIHDGLSDEELTEIAWRAGIIDVPA